jgi:Fe-S cluster assembly ATP-binding protein
MLLNIKNLYAKAGETEILKGLNLAVNPGEIHVIMGRNGSGKSTLSHVLTGRDGYTVTNGSIEFEGKDLLSLAPEERACSGLFLAFQYPLEIPGVTNIYLLKASVNAMRRYRGEPELTAAEFFKMVRLKLKDLKMDESFLNRNVNEGFSGGEKKRNEILQMALLEPKLAILDEIDSGLDIDAMKIVAENVNQLRNSAHSIILITHYQRLLDYITPDFVHVLADGQIVKSGDQSLALELEAKGYEWLTHEIPA